MKHASLRTRIIAISLAAVAVTAVACLLIQRSIIRRQGIELTREAMRGVLLGAENTRQSVSAMNEQKMFDPKLAGSVVKGSDYKTTKIYNTVPVVSAWRAIEQVAAKEGYRFHIAAHSPRNPQNQPRPEEVALLERFETQGQSDYFAVDEDRGEIVYARPIRLTRDCLMCHGDPKLSAAKDGRDLLGFPMENWKDGQVHGAFVLRADLDRLTPVIRAGVIDTVAWIVPIALAIGVIVFFLVQMINRRLDSLAIQLSGCADTVNGAVDDLSSASQSLVQGATEHSAALEETSSSSEEINAMARRNNENSHNVAEMVAKSQENFVEANTSLDEMESAISDIKEQSDRISKIIKIIDEIAFQTNILALNAAVEAARAGDAGLGFAVVADEVRNLAQRSAQAARDTTGLIEESIAKAATGKQTVDHVVSVMRRITEDSARIKVLIDEVNVGSTEQTRGIEQISQAMSQMEQVTRASVADADRTAGSATGLAEQAANLKLIVADLTELVRGS